MSFKDSSKVSVDTSVQINFLKIDRMDLFEHSHHRFFVTDHVKAEINSFYPEQLSRFQKALQKNMIEEVSLSEPDEMDIFITLSKLGKLGAGECSAIALAIKRNYKLAIDDTLAIKCAKTFSPSLQILRTQDLMVEMIQTKVIDVPNADQILNDWASQYRFKLKINSFSELI